MSAVSRYNIEGLEDRLQELLKGLDLWDDELSIEQIHTLRFVFECWLKHPKPDDLWKTLKGPAKSRLVSDKVLELAHYVKENMREHGCSQSEAFSALNISKDDRRAIKRLFDAGDYNRFDYIYFHKGPTYNDDD